MRGWAMGDADNPPDTSEYFAADHVHGPARRLVGMANPEEVRPRQPDRHGRDRLRAESGCLTVGMVLGDTDGQLGADFAGGVAER